VPNSIPDPGWPAKMPHRRLPLSSWGYLPVNRQPYRISDQPSRRSLRDVPIRNSFVGWGSHLIGSQEAGAARVRPAGSRSLGASGLLDPSTARGLYVPKSPTLYARADTPGYRAEGVGRVLGRACRRDRNIAATKFFRSNFFGEEIVWLRKQSVRIWVVHPTMA
jgi:hypothetical protein